MDLFSANGRIHRELDELFTEVAWLQVMLGQGVVPAGWHPLADRIDEAQMGRFLTSIQKIIGSTVDKLPNHEAFINKFCKAG
jgi:tryptophan halogenase